MSKNSAVKHEHSSKSLRSFVVKNSVIQLCSGLGSGLIVTVALTPWDKGLYLSVTENRTFLDIKNFRQPFQGVGQSLFQRSVSHGLYFPLEHFAYSLSSNNLKFGTNTLYPEIYRNLICDK